MAELPDKLLGIDIDGSDGSRSGRTRSADDPGQDAEERIRVVLFRVGDHRFAVPVDDVRTTTELQEDVTPVPRAADVIEGVVDLRGEVTAVLDPSVHFPPARVDPDSDQLLVFERPADLQAAAIRVDDVLRVEPVPESKVHDEESIADSPFDGDALEHPLVAALLERERRPTRRLEDPVVTPEPVDGAGEAGSDPERERTGSGADASDPAVESFDLEEDDGAADVSATGATADRVIVEGTPLIDVEDFLAASGQRGDSQPALETDPA
ncbi:chemotaxis protein CheW [Halobiforma lacisalsi AJ5]|uniref:CheW protein n=1 Tax=Natronobacterium lacisalsi AJ5 TaxID=358396 RepID=M0LPQ1_NATLA|nr:chemotaxis protein CheW [Halobiforma lacisalsi]APW99681.1 chemotaxis protein CheW [Halobiforma lacisalsi AJ5]EMA35527.1 CheW protein [Halobiforma lacisalsi AJ5]